MSTRKRTSKLSTIKAVTTAITDKTDCNDSTKINPVQIVIHKQVSTVENRQKFLSKKSENKNNFPEISKNKNFLENSKNKNFPEISENNTIVEISANNSGKNDEEQQNRQLQTVTNKTDESDVDMIDLMTQHNNIEISTNFYKNLQKSTTIYNELHRFPTNLYRQNTNNSVVSTNFVEQTELKQLNDDNSSVIGAVSSRHNSDVPLLELIKVVPTTKTTKNNKPTITKPTKRTNKKRKHSGNKNKDKSSKKQKINDPIQEIKALQNKLIDAENKILLNKQEIAVQDSQISQLVTERKQKEIEKGSLHNDLCNTRNVLQRLRKKIKELKEQKDNTAANNQLFQLLEQQIETDNKMDLDNDTDMLQQDVTSLQEQLDDTNAELAKKNDIINKITIIKNTEFQTLQSLYDKQVEEIKELQQQFKSLLDKYNEEKTSYKAAYDDINDKYKNNMKESKKGKEKNKRLQQQVTSLQESIQRYTEEQTRLQVTHIPKQKYEKHIMELQKKIKDNDEFIKQDEKKKKNSQKQYQINIQTVKDQMAEQKQQVEEFKNKITEEMKHLHNNIKRLQEENISLIKEKQNLQEKVTEKQNIIDLNKQKVTLQQCATNNEDNDIDYVNNVAEDNNDLILDGNNFFPDNHTIFDNKNNDDEDPNQNNTNHNIPTSYEPIRPQKCVFCQVIHINELCPFVIKVKNMPTSEQITTTMANMFQEFMKNFQQNVVEHNKTKQKEISTSGYKQKPTYTNRNYRNPKDSTKNNKSYKNSTSMNVTQFVDDEIEENSVEDIESKSNQNESDDDDNYQQLDNNNNDNNEYQQLYTKNNDNEESYVKEQNMKENAFTPQLLPQIQKKLRTGETLTDAEVQSHTTWINMTQMSQNSEIKHMASNIKLSHTLKELIKEIHYDGYSRPLYEIIEQFNRIKESSFNKLNQLQLVDLWINHILTGSAKTYALTKREVWRNNPNLLQIYKELRTQFHQQSRYTSLYKQWLSYRCNPTKTPVQNIQDYEQLLSQMKIHYKIEENFIKSADITNCPLKDQNRISRKLIDSIRPINKDFYEKVLEKLLEYNANIMDNNYNYTKNDYKMLKGVIKQIGIIKCRNNQNSIGGRTKTQNFKISTNSTQKPKFSTNFRRTQPIMKKCINCNKTGHTITECWFNKRNYKQQINTKQSPQKSENYNPNKHNQNHQQKRFSTWKNNQNKPVTYENNNNIWRPRYDNTWKPPTRNNNNNNYGNFHKRNNNNQKYTNNQQQHNISDEKPNQYQSFGKEKQYPRQSTNQKRQKH